MAHSHLITLNISYIDLLDLATSLAEPTRDVRRPIHDSLAGLNSVIQDKDIFDVEQSKSDVDSNSETSNDSPDEEWHGIDEEVLSGMEGSGPETHTVDMPIAQEENRTHAIIISCISIIQIRRRDTICSSSFAACSARK